MSPPKTHASIGNRAAFTLLESMLGVGMLGLFLSFVMVLSSNVLGLVRTSKDNVSANQALQERIEQMRIANWVQITDASHLASHLLAAETASSSALDRPIETVTISPYPEKGGAKPVKLVRQDGVTTVLSSNGALVQERMVRIDLELAWSGFPQDRQRLRSTCVLIAKGGITK